MLALPSRNHLPIYGLQGTSRLQLLYRFLDTCFERIPPVLTITLTPTNVGSSEQELSIDLWSPGNTTSPVARQVLGLFERILSPLVPVS